MDFTYKSKATNPKLSYNEHINDLRVRFPCKSCPSNYYFINCRTCLGNGFNQKKYQDWLKSQKTKEMTPLTLKRIDHDEFPISTPCFNFTYAIYCALWLSIVIFQICFLAVSIRSLSDLTVGNSLILASIIYHLLMSILSVIIHRDKGLWLLYYFRFELKVNRKLTYFLFSRFQNDKVYVYSYRLPLLVFMILNISNGIYIAISEKKFNRYYVMIYISFFLSLVVCVLHLILIQKNKQKVKHHCKYTLNSETSSDSSGDIDLQV